MKTMIQTFVYAIMLSLMLTLVVRAAETQQADKTQSPYFFIKDGDSSIDLMWLADSRADVLINGVIADVTVTQTYLNKGNRPVNARYVFPASTRAAVHGMTMTVKDVIIEARIKERQKAKQAFEKAKQEGKSASLLEQQRPNVFTMDVANVMPGDTINIKLNYTELLVPEDGTYCFVYPTVVGPRYSNRKQPAEDSGQWVKNPYLAEGRPSKIAFTITTTLSSAIAIQEVDCPSHDVIVDYQDKKLAKIRLGPLEKTGGNRDYILNFRLMGKQIESGLMLFKGEEENFFLLMAQPPQQVHQAEIPTREYIFVVDVSGSMSGFPLNVSKTLLRDLIGNLRPSDSFNVLLFAGSSFLMAPASLPATPGNIDRAIQVIDTMRGRGGTELLPALEKAVQLPTDETTSRSILVITDGYIAAEKSVFQCIAKNIGNTNLFAFGIGSSVNHYLIEGLARAGHGEPFAVTEPHKAPGAAEKFRKYIRSPVLTNIKIRFKGFDAYDVEPAAIADMLALRPVVVYGKWKGEPVGRIELTGTGGSGIYQNIIEVEKNRPSDQNSALEYLWARKRIEKISDHYFYSRTKDRISEITSLGLTYNLLTDYTSFIAVYDVIRNKRERAEDVTQVLPLPKGVSNLALCPGMTQGPEPEMHLLLGLLALVFIIAWFRKRKNHLKQHSNLVQHNLSADTVTTRRIP